MKSKPVSQQVGQSGSDSLTGSLSVLKVASDEQVVKAYRAAEETAAELVQSPLFKSFTRRSVISGLLLAEKKQEIGHGNWLPWCAKHKIEDRTARRHIETARATCDTLQIGHRVRFDDLALHQVLQLPPAQLVNSAKETREKFDVLIDSKTTKEIVVEWKASDAPRQKGGLLPIRFHCPSCQVKGEKTLLKQIAGRNIKCYKCGETVKAKPDVKDTTAQDRERVDGELGDLAAKLDGLFHSATGDAPNQSERAKCSDEAWRNLVRACQQISTFDRHHGKDFRKSIARDGAKEAKGK
jgi:hypothetical protein